MSQSGHNIKKRLNSLESHLKNENPVLLSAVKSYRQLDRVAYRMGILHKDESYATQISWWPLISILGTFSSGKSTFINQYLGQTLQRTGNQAVDDHFTVISYSREPEARVLPGVALDSDPRFPFYQISEDLELVAAGEGQRIDAYLQLKTCPSEKLRGKVIIDSPGFDADAQRTATLRITDHIMNLSDLVLVIFDARHPEPGAMRDTLVHLVENTIHRPDPGKFMYILNQIDSTAREDNLEDIVGAWQRAIAEKGLTAGRFYTIYNPDVAIPIEDNATRERFESKRDADLGEIHERMQQVEVERAYRIIGSLEKHARDIGDRIVPKVRAQLRRWRKRVLWSDLVAAILGVTAFIGITSQMGYWQDMGFQPPWLDSFSSKPGALYVALLLVTLLALGTHYLIRHLNAKLIARTLAKEESRSHERGDVARAFLRSTRFWRSIHQQAPAGWNRINKRRIEKLLLEIDSYVQTLNDQFTNPSGTGQEAHATPVAAAVATPAASNEPDGSEQPAEPVVKGVA